MKNSVACIAATDELAVRIVNDLRAAGFPASKVSVLIADKSGVRDVSHEKGTKAPEGAAAGGSAGGLLGGALGWLVGIGALAIPGLGPFVAAGPLLAALSGAAIGAAVGGVTGALIGLGIPEYEAKLYEAKLRKGGSLIVVHCDSNEEVDLAKDIMERNSATDISSLGATGSAKRDTDDRPATIVETQPQRAQRVQPL